MTHAPDTPWDILDPELRELWAEGVTTAEIGRRIGKTKNAVVGRAHRLNLPPRPAPVVRTGPGMFERRYSGRGKPAAGPKTRPSRVPKPVAAVAAAEAVPAPVVEPAAPVAPELVVAPVAVALPPPVDEAACELPDVILALPVPVPARVPVQAEEYQHGRCRWPLWGNHERAGRPQRFCTAGRVPGQSYCAAHCAVAYRGDWAMAEDVEEAA